MKVTVEPQEKAKEIKYPCLMINGRTNVIVLMNSNGCGVSLDIDTGFFSYNWDMRHFTPYNGKVILEND